MNAMNASDDGKIFLQICLAKRLLDKAQAQAIWQQSRHDGVRPQQLLVKQGLLAQHTVNALEKELRQAQEPRIIAGFRLIKPLGQGGMATVFLAQQISLGREVALKLISPQIAANPGACERFLREARIAATVNHPNVVSIIDVGQVDGQLFMALELVSGGDAAQLAGRFGGVLPEPRALELLIDCAKGLQALYEARLVHRDLKPSNIFIAKDGSAKLGDLGLARSEDGADRLTLTGNLVGTPAFMSPEQAGGEGVIDTRSDIYALGATLFALVTGRQPFTGSTPIAVAAKALTEAAPDPRTVNPALSSATAELILRAMAKSQASRFQTPQELCDALRQALVADPSVQDPAPPKVASVQPLRSATAVTMVGDHRSPRRVTPPHRGWPAWTPLALAVALGAAIALVAVGLSAAPSAGAPMAPDGAGIAAGGIATVTKKTPTVESPLPPVPAAKPTADLSPPPPASTPVSVPPRVADPAASPPAGAAPPQIAWAAQGRDEYGPWIMLTVKGVSQRLRWLPPGTATVGSPVGDPERIADTEAESSVTFTYGSWLADTECTQAMWEAVVGANPARQRGAELPVTGISVVEAIAFTHALRPHVGGARVRLPSRAEWERACRAGTSTRFATGDDLMSLKGFANVSDIARRAKINERSEVTFSDGFSELAPVASFRANRWGYYDMHGNVTEFCLAFWESLPPVCKDPLTDDDAQAQTGFLRGGSFAKGTTALLRCAAMPFLGKDAKTDDVGFRFLIEDRH